MLGIFSLVIDDSARFLQLVTPERAASAIWIAGGILFLVKLVAWRRERRAGERPHHLARFLFNFRVHVQLIFFAQTDRELMTHEPHGQLGQETISNPREP